MIPSPLRTWLRHGTTKTRDIVVDILKQHPEYGLTTKKVYEQAHALYPDASEDAPLHQGPTPPRSRKGKSIMPPPGPEFPNHPIRSVKYLKLVLGELKTQGVIEKVVFRTLPEGRPLSEANNPANMVWRWRLRRLKTEEQP